MTNPHLLAAGWRQTKQHIVAVIAAALMYGGIHQILSAVRDPLGILIMKLINAPIQHSFPDHSLLPKFGPIPWAFYVRVVCEGIFLAVVGTFVGLWVNARSQRHPAA